MDVRRAVPAAQRSSVEVVHCRHAMDGWPLCWPQDKEGGFRGSYRDADVTCPECLNLMVDD